VRKVAIIGTGNIGTDLLLKLLKVNYVQVVAFVGRRDNSKGIELAKKKSILCSSKGIDYFINNPGCCEIVYDCTNAEDAILHAKIFEDQNIKVIDLTPAKVGPLCVPSINPNALVQSNNVNMITCGGQASLPLLTIVKEHCESIKYIELISQIASDSAGMGTRINIDKYIQTTETAIERFTECKNNKVILNLNPAVPQVDMQTTVFVETIISDFQELKRNIHNQIKEIKKYIPYYQLVMDPIYKDGVLILSIKVRGSGDFLPSYAGNLDIINCAAIQITKIYAE
jgi:acetaldehyde dehydrogenase